MFEVAAEVGSRWVSMRWHGHRFLGMDGSKINLPNDSWLREYFGVIGTDNRHKPGLGVQCQLDTDKYDLGVHITDEQISGIKL
jgi:hypothetical protein